MQDTITSSEYGIKRIANALIMQGLSSGELSEYSRIELYVMIDELKFLRQMVITYKPNRKTKSYQAFKEYLLNCIDHRIQSLKLIERGGITP
jgi:hypothetical protein